MQITAIEGVVEKGQIRLREKVSLAENTKVYVIVADASTDPSLHLRTPRLAHPSQAQDFRKQVVGSSPNAKV